MSVLGGPETIRFDGVGLTYPGATTPALEGVDLSIGEGELVLVVGTTGSGKSTLLRAINGLVPHFSGGHLSGRVTVAGRSTQTHRPRDLADAVGFVAQDPASSFVTDTVEDELAYGMESLGVAPQAMRRRVEETLDLLGLAEIRRRGLRTLSGGQQQRVAIGAVLAAGPRVLVLDEPTSALDPVAAEDVLASITRLVHDLGLTVVVAEHRLERVVHHCDGIVLVGGGSATPVLAPDVAMAASPVHPPVVSLGRRLGWSPLPLSVRDARRDAAGLRDRLASSTVVLPRSSSPTPRGAEAAELGRATALRARQLVVERGRTTVLDGVTFTLGRGEVVALMGRNGAGKSTLLGALAGLVPRRRGSVDVGGLDPARATPADRVHAVGLVPQDPSTILYTDSVGRECAEADRDLGAPPGTCRGLFDRMLGTDAAPVEDARHPRDLSEGQRLLLALAIVLSASPGVLLLDEPTRGLDYLAKERLSATLVELAAAGHAVLVATHDVELAADTAHRVLLVAEGEIVADGEAHEILCGSPAFAPQVAKVMYPLPLMTVADVEGCA